VVHDFGWFSDTTWGLSVGYASPHEVRNELEYLLHAHVVFGAGFDVPIESVDRHVGFGFGSDKGRNVQLGANQQDGNLSRVLSDELEPIVEMKESDWTRQVKGKKTSVRAYAISWHQKSEALFPGKIPDGEDNGYAVDVDVVGGEARADGHALVEIDAREISVDQRCLANAAVAYHD